MKLRQIVLILCCLITLPCARAMAQNTELSIVKSDKGMNYLVLTSNQEVIDTIYAFAYEAVLLDSKIIASDLICFVVAGCHGECVNYIKVKPNQENIWINKT